MPQWWLKDMLFIYIAGRISTTVQCCWNPNGTLCGPIKESGKTGGNKKPPMLVTNNQNGFICRLARLQRKSNRAIEFYLRKNGVRSGPDMHRRNGASKNIGVMTNSPDAYGRFNDNMRSKLQVSGFRCRVSGKKKFQASGGISDLLDIWNKLTNQ